MSKTVRIAKCLSKYHCLMDKCSNDCCSKWAISVDNETVEKWKKKAPQLLRLIEEKKDDNGKFEEWRMIKNANRVCMAQKDGKCIIQSEHGEDMIPNLCGYFPHLYKNVCGTNYASINLACPAVVKCLLKNGKDDWKFVDWKPNYEKKKITTYDADEVGDFSYDECEEFFSEVLDLFEDKKTNFDILLTSFVKVIFEDYKLSLKQLRDNIQYEFENAKKLIKSEYNKNKTKKGYALFALLDSLYGIEGDSINENLIAVMKTIKDELGVKDVNKISIADFESMVEKYDELLKIWKTTTGKTLQKILKNYLKCRMSQYMFPVIETVLDDSKQSLSLIVFELLLVRLCLMCHIKTNTDLKNEEKIIHIVSVIGRIFHGSGTKTMFSSMSEYGWCDYKKLKNAILYY